MFGTPTGGSSNNFRIYNNQQVGPQAAPHQFDLFLNPFNDFGRTVEGPIGANAVPFVPGAAPSTHFLKLILWRRAGPLFQSRVCNQAGVISVANQALLVAVGANPPEVAVRASITELVLWLKRPRIARGQSKTYSYTPAETGFMGYYGKLDTLGQLVGADPTNFAEFDGFDQKQPLTLGSFRIRFTRWLANVGVTTASRRTIGELEITLNAQDLFDFIEDGGNAHAETREHTLILRTGTPLCKAFPTRAEQLGGQGPLVSAHRGRMILRFQKLQKN